MNYAERIAFTPCPKLRRLAGLRGGCGFEPTPESEPDVMVLIQHVRIWPNGCADAWGVRGQA